MELHNDTTLTSQAGKIFQAAANLKSLQLQCFDVCLQQLQQINIYTTAALCEFTCVIGSCNALVKSITSECIFNLL